MMNRQVKVLQHALVPKLQLGNPEGEAPASRDGKLELPKPNSQAGAWELAISWSLGTSENMLIKMKLERLC
jgi:hypothetical protein